MRSKIILGSKSGQDTTNQDQRKRIQTVISLQNIQAIDNDCQLLEAYQYRVLDPTKQRWI